MASRYCLADDRLLDAVRFLDLGDGAGWELLQVESFYITNINYFLLIFFTEVINEHFLVNGS